MWKVGACVLLLLNLSLHSVTGNGSYGGGWKEESGAAQAQPQAAASGANSQAGSYPEYDSPAPAGKEQDLWWLKDNPFQKPPNHPGLEKADQATPSAPSNARPFANQQPASNSRPKPQQPAVPAYGGQSQYNTGAFSQQPSRPREQSQNYNTQPSPNAYNRAPQPNQQYNQSPQPAAAPECLLRNQADCHAAGPATLGNADQGNVNYQQQQPSAGYPSDDSISQNQGSSQYQINIPVPQKTSRLPNNLLDQQQPATFQLGQKPEDAGQKGFVSNNAQYQPNNQPRPYQNPAPQPVRPNFAPSGQVSQNVNNPGAQTNSYNQAAPNSGNPYYGGSPNPQPQNDYSNKVAYQPPSLPYQEPTRQTQSQNNAQGFQPPPPSTGNLNNNYEEQPPYPGCPAAMLCVPESYCNSKGVSEGKPISLSPAEKLYRVALMACSAPTTGEVGVCCRDPDYKDPWPNMGGNGGHEHQHGAFDDGQYHPPATPQAQPSQAAQSGAPVNPAQPYASNQGIQTAASFNAPQFFQCQHDEECVEDFKCHQGFTSEATTQVTSATNKCKADFDNLSFVCCRRNYDATTSGESYFTTPASKRYELTEATTVQYTKNYFLQNTLGTTVPSLVTGRGFPYVQRATPNLRFSNPYRSNERPIYLITTSTPATTPQQLEPVSTTSATTTEQPHISNQYHLTDTVENEDRVEVTADQEAVPLKLVLRKEDEASTKNSTSAFSEPSPTPEALGTTEQSPTEMGNTEEPTGVTDPTITDESDQNSTFFYNPNPWSVDDEFNPPQPVQVPHQFYQLPALPEIETPEEVPTTTSEPVETQDEPIFAARAGFPAKKNFVEECPNNMKCLRESYCQEVNPNEGNTDLFDIRLSFRKAANTILKCKQKNLPVDGVCCFLREDYMSQVTTRPLSIHIEPTVPPLPEEVCGVRHKKKNPEYETEYTEFGEFPWQALIVAGDRQCSGAILNDRVIATTASCLHNLTDAEIEIRVGEWDRKNTFEVKQHQDLQVAAIIRQPKYIHSNLSYNIALIYTTEKIEFNYHIGRICLPQPVSNFEGKPCVLTGWSSARRAFRGSDRSNERFLLQAELKTLDSVDCVQRLQKTSLGTEFKLPRTTLCAGGESKRDTCNGDEGSPLYCENSSSGDYVLAGFLMGTDWGVNCGRPEVPGVFVNLPTVIEWMYNFIRQDPAAVISSQQRFQKNKMSH